MLSRLLCDRLVHRPVTLCGIALRSATSATHRHRTPARSPHYTNAQSICTSKQISQAAAPTTATHVSTQLLDPAAELAEFMSVFPDVVNHVTAAVQRYELPATTQASSWLAQAMLYNVPKGKRNRGLLTVSTFKLLQALQQPKPDESTGNICKRYVCIGCLHCLKHLSFTFRNLARADVMRAQQLGWCVEMLQALFLVADDIMDHSETRRGALCWYKVPAVGLTAVNDTLMIENLIYSILRCHFAADPCYVALIELFHEAMLVTCIGESLDLQTAQQAVATFNLRQYTSIAHNKTAFYSFYLPVASAMLMAGHREPLLFAQVRDILYEIGLFFQVQDDYLDCFGDPAVTGKIGTDIQDKKCSWLVVQCLEKASDVQRSMLEQCYGQPDSVDAVRALYEEMALPQLFGEYEERSYADICARIRQLPDTIPRVIFEQIMDVIYQRKH